MNTYKFLYHHNPNRWVQLLLRRGLFQFHFLPFGLHVSLGIFQANTAKMIQVVHRVLSYQDDVIIFGATRGEHDSRLKSVLHRLIQSNVSITTTQCKFGVSELEFTGFKISATSYQPSPSLILGDASTSQILVRPEDPGCHGSTSPSILV